MAEIFKTVIMLSGLGGGFTLLLLLLKPVTMKRFPAKWQYYIWLAVIVIMVFPFWKCIPQKQAALLVPQLSPVQPQAELDVQTPAAENFMDTEKPQEGKGAAEMSLQPRGRISLLTLAGYLWAVGAAVFMAFALGSYIVFLLKSRRKSYALQSNSILEQVQKELGIRRRVRIRTSGQIQSPLLAGTIFPVIYLPTTQLPAEKMYMVFRHELTHLKRGDLLYKWLSLVVNAIHWFNPLAYLLCANINEACEISCDMAVTQDMPSERQALYMKTILDLIQEKRR